MVLELNKVGVSTMPFAAWELELEDAELEAELEEAELEAELEFLFTVPEIVVVEPAPALADSWVDKVALKFTADTPSIARQQEKNSWLIDLVDMHSVTT